MADFFSSIIGFFQYMYDFLVMSVATMIRGLRLVFESYTMVSGVIGKLPSIIFLSMSIIIATAVIKFIFGRMTS